MIGVYEEEKCLIQKLMEWGIFYIRLDLKNMYGNLSIDLWNEVSGLDIECLKNRGYETDCAFHIYDFEQSGLSVYCEEIKAILSILMKII